MEQSWRQYSERRVPRYTSYPSALEFSDKVGAIDYAEKIAEIDLYEPLSLYVHVPFCRQLCWYCGCNMRVCNRYDRAQRYVEALTREVDLIGGLLDGRGRPVSVHFGGGTPNYLKLVDLEVIVRRIEDQFGLTDDARLAIELDPRLIEKGDIAALAGLGFSRMSLGVQDLDDDVQRAINRIQSFELIESVVGDMRAAGVDDVSFDLLYGLPKQTLASFARTIEKSIALGPDRLSVFGYAHLPQAFPRQRMIDDDDLPDETHRSQLAELADAMLLDAGYRRIGFDHYAKPDNSLAHAARSGRLRRNFQGFTDDVAETFIGLGASSIGFVHGLYIQNEKTAPDYEARVAAGSLPVSRGRMRTRRDEIVARAIHDFLCAGETNIAPVLKAAGPAQAIEISRALDRFEREAVIEWSDDRILLKPEAYGLARVVASALDPYLYQKQMMAAAV